VAITETAKAFSPREGPKTYVQHLVRGANAIGVWSHDRKTRDIYVCGDDGKMQPDIQGRAGLLDLNTAHRTGSRGGSGQLRIEELCAPTQSQVLTRWAWEGRITDFSCVSRPQCRAPPRDHRPTRATVRIVKQSILKIAHRHGYGSSLRR